MNFEDSLPSGPGGRPEAVLPMINLVFLLLIFFLIAATLAPPSPVAVEEPRASAEERLDPGTLRVALTAKGVLAFASIEGDAARAVLEGRLRTDAARKAIALHADGAAPARAVAQTVHDLAALGAGPIWLVVEDPR